MRVGLILDMVLRLLSFAVLAEALMSWFAPPRRRGVYYSIRRVVSDITEPVLTPIRRLLPDTGQVDFSPLIAMFLIEFVRKWVLRIL